MSYGTVESSRTQGAPISLYKFMWGDNDVLAYTNAEQPYTYLDQEYTPIPIDRTNITASGTTDKTAMTISVPEDSPISNLFEVFPPSSVVNVIVFDGHPESNVDFKAVWSGRVLSCGRDDASQAKLTCQPITTSIKRPGLRRRWQLGCPLTLYGTQCGASKAAATVTADILSIDGINLKFSVGWNGALEKDGFLNGMIEWSDGDKLRIISVDVDNDILMVSGRTLDLTTGMTVSVIQGCDHLVTGCTMHNNINNYGGDPTIPLQNPVGYVNLYN